MRSAFALRPSLHAFACALTRRVYGVGLCMRRMSSAAVSDPSHDDQALHEPLAIGGHVNPLPCVLCVGHFHVSVPGVGVRTSRARPRACRVQSLEPPETLACGGSGSGPDISQAKTSRRGLRGARR